MHIAQYLQFSVLTDSLIRTQEELWFSRYRGKLDIRGVFLFIQSDPFWDGPGLTILIGLWLPVDKKVYKEQRQEENHSEWKAISESINCHIITTLTFIQTEPLLNSLKNIYLKKENALIIPLWPKNYYIVILHICIILCFVSDSAEERVPAVSPGEHHWYSMMVTKGPLLSWIFSGL